MNRLSALPALSELRRLRIITFFLLYVSQGVPLGLSLVAIPAWLSANGSGPAEVGTFVGFAMLPWSLKLVNGLIMDRFCFRPMGVRRAWVIGAQVLMVTALAVTALLNPGAADVTQLAACCFALNLCATFNDVGVDGMAVDLVPEDERERTNAFMFGGQAIGISGSSAIAGAALMVGGVALAATIFAVLVGLLTVLVALFRERPGERLLPWTAGTASAECLTRGQDRWWPIFTQVLSGLFRPRTLLFLAGFALIATSAGMADTIGATFSVSQLGWSSAEYSNFYSISSLVTSVSAIGVIAVLTSRFGSQRVFAFSVGVLALANLAAFLALPTAFGTLAMQFYITVFWGTFIVTTILGVAWSMNLTNPAVAASQFALFMAIPNLVRSFASGAHGHLAETHGYGASFLVAAICIVIGGAICAVAGMGRNETIPVFAKSPRPEAPTQPRIPMPEIAG